MPSVLLGPARRKRWTPTPASSLDYDHPFAQNLWDCVLWGGVNVGPARVQPTTTGTVTRAGTPAGDGFYTTGGASYDLAANGRNYTDDGATFRAVTLRYRFIPVTWPAAQTGVAVKGTATTNRDFGVYFDTSGNVSLTHFAGGASGQGTSASAVLTGLTAGLFWDLVVVYDGGTGVAYYVNGQTVGSVTLSAHSTLASNAAWTIGRDAATPANNPDMVVAAAMSWVGRALTDSQVAQLYDEPFAMFAAPDARRYAFLSGNWARPRPTFRTYNQGAAIYDAQAELDSVDFDALTGGYRNDGVIYGCAVAAQSTPTLTVTVASGQVAVRGVYTTVAATTVTAAAADSTHPRFDLVVVDHVGTVSLVTGTPALEAVFPAVPANSVAVASLYIPAGAAAVTQAQIAAKTVPVSPADGDQATLASLPYFLAGITDYNDYTKGTLTVLSLGSSVGVGGGLTSPSTDAPGAHLTTALAAKVNKLGNYSIQHYNGCGNGHAFADAQADYAAAKALATGTTVLVPIVFGMNDGLPSSYHSGQTYPNVRTYIRQVAADIRNDHADPLLFTSPHPHTGRETWTTGSAIVYPGSNQMIPDSTTGQSIVPITLKSGRTINVSYRHLRVNEMIRRTGAEIGVPVIDAERFWFEAIADRGEDALFDVAEVVHPNLLGHQLSYWAATDAWVRSIDTLTSVSTLPQTAQMVHDEQFNVQIASPITLTLVDKQHGILLVRAWHGGIAARHAGVWLYLGDSGVPGARIASMGQLAGNVVTVATSGYNITLTPNFAGATIAYTMIQGYPLP